MRLDKFLQLSGIIPRRTQAQEACIREYVQLNGRRAKPSATVVQGDHISVQMRGRQSEYEVLKLPLRPMPKTARHEAARLLHSKIVDNSQ
ncbi:MAG: S4 domain-containing protein [Candidatus Zipacnadales bacterium]